MSLVLLILSLNPNHEQLLKFMQQHHDVIARHTSDAVPTYQGLAESLTLYAAEMKDRLVDTCDADFDRYAATATEVLQELMAA